MADKQTEPTASEWALARAVHAELAGSSLSDEQRHLVRVVLLDVLVKQRALSEQAEPPLIALTPGWRGGDDG